MSTIQVGAFEAGGIAGVSLACGGDALGIRLVCPHPAIGLFDGRAVLLNLDPPQQHAPDQGYVRYSWQVPVTPAGVKRFAGHPYNGVNSPNAFDYAPGEAVRVILEWRQEGEIVRGRYTAEGPLRAGLIANGCFAPAAVHVAEPTIGVLFQHDAVLVLKLRGAVETPLLVNDLWQAEQAWFGTPVSGEAMALYPVTLAPDAPCYFAMRLADRQRPMQVDLADPDPVAIDAALAAGAAAYEAARMRSGGALAGAAEAVAGLAGYSWAYDPERQRVQTTVNRTWRGPNAPGCIFGWDNFFTSYSAAWENPALGAASLEHVIATYAEHGIPYGPTQRNLIIPILYARTLDVLGDDALARRTWPAMMDFMRFWYADRGDGIAWRDGNSDGLIESGVSTDPRHSVPGRLLSDAMDETGYDDIPIYSDGFTDGRRGLPGNGVTLDPVSRCLTIAQVGQSSLYVAACAAMARRAEALGYGDDAAWLRADGARVAGCIRAKLLDPVLGIYQDRRWDGTFSPVKTMTNFYPLLAGIAEGDVADRLRAMLLDPAQFWGENLIPTVSRDDPAYCDGLDGRGNYWRGNCWPPTTYMVYLALKEAGWDEIAAEYARRVTAQFMDYWTRYGHAYENYPPEGAVDHRFPYVSGWGGREVRYTWSAMMPLCGLEELFAPEVSRPGVRFGNPYLGDARWEGFRFGGVRVTAAGGAARTAVTFGDAWTFLAEPGVAVRGFHHADDGFRGTIVAPAAATLRLTAPGLTGAATLDGVPAAARRAGNGVVITVPAGAHDLLLPATRSAAVG
jgi:hypothetical protein